MASGTIKNPNEIPLFTGSVTKSSTYPPDTLKVFKKGGNAHLAINLLASASYTLPQSFVTIGTLPTGFRPNETYSYPIEFGDTQVRFAIYPNGNIQVYNYKTSKPSLACTITFPVT